MEFDMLKKIKKREEKDTDRDSKKEKTKPSIFERFNN